MKNKRSYEFCPNRKLGLEGIEDKRFGCGLTMSFSRGCDRKYYEECSYTGDNFRRCQVFKDGGSNSGSGYMGCSAAAIR